MLAVLVLALTALAALVSAANADFPYGTGAPHYQTGPGVTPNDIAVRGAGHVRALILS